MAIRGTLKVGALRYIRAQDPPVELGPIEDITKDPGAADPGLSDLLKEYTPEKEEEAPADEDQDLIEQRFEQTVNTLEEKGLPATVKKLADLSYDMLKKHGVKHQLVKEYYLEDDGVDVVIDLDPRNIKQAEILFDFTTSWGDELVNIVEDPSKLFQPTGSTLNEILVSYCGGMYAASSTSLVSGLLNAIATLQTVDTRPKNTLPKPDPKNQVDRLEWAMEIVAQMMGRNPNVRYEGPNSAIDQAKEDEEAGNLNAGVAGDFAEVVKSIDSSAWQKLVKENSTAIKSKKWLPSKKAITIAINQLTKGKYKEKIKLTYDDDGSIIAFLIAPFPIIVRFERKAGKVEFKEIATSICDILFVTTDEKLASDLVFANVNLGIAAGEVANDNVSKERSKPLKNEEELEAEVAKRLLVEMQVEPPANPIMENEPYRSISEVVLKNPKGFLSFVAKNKDKALKFLEQNKVFLNWIRKTNEDLFNQLKSLATEPEGQSSVGL